MTPLRHRMLGRVAAGEEIPLRCDVVELLREYEAAVGREALVVAERDRDRTALKVEACEKWWPPYDTTVGCIAFRVTRAPGGTLVAEEIAE